MSPGQTMSSWGELLFILRLFLSGVLASTDPLLSLFLRAFGVVLPKLLLLLSVFVSL